MKQCYLRDYEKKFSKACWCPQVPKISLLKLLASLISYPPLWSPNSPLDVGTKFTFHTLELKAFITPPRPQKPFSHPCLKAHCCPSPSLISPVVSLPPINKWESARNAVRTQERELQHQGDRDGDNSRRQTAALRLWRRVFLL